MAELIKWGEIKLYELINKYESQRRKKWNSRQTNNSV